MLCISVTILYYHRSLALRQRRHAPVRRLLSGIVGVVIRRRRVTALRIGWSSWGSGATATTQSGYSCNTLSTQRGYSCNTLSTCVCDIAGTSRMYTHFNISYIISYSYIYINIKFVCGGWPEGPGHLYGCGCRGGVGLSGAGCGRGPGTYAQKPREHHYECGCGHLPVGLVVLVRGLVGCLSISLDLEKQFYIRTYT